VFVRFFSGGSQYLRAPRVYELELLGGVLLAQMFTSPSVAGVPVRCCH